MTDDPRAQLESHVRAILALLGDDPEREGLRDTPRRVVRAWEEMLVGRDAKLSMPTSFDANGHDQMIVVRGIRYFSLCEHHLLPFYGTATVGYLPNARILGLSKMPRLVAHYARRLQTQEQLTDQIARGLLRVTKARGVGVRLEGKHLCMMARGVREADATMVTSALHGVMRDGPPRAEFLDLARPHQAA